MSTNHVTSTVAQRRTDHWLVFQAHAGALVLVKQVEVPRYSQPDGTGTLLSRDKRLSLAVARAVESPRSGVVGEPFEGEEFLVQTALGADEFEPVEYEQNPAFAGVWDPEGDA